MQFKTHLEDSCDLFSILMMCFYVLFCIQEEYDSHGRKWTVENHVTVSRGYSRERGEQKELGRIVWRESGGGDSPQ